ncbi:hypothetical protein FBALC1_03137 [Flavobacteriales bacterium ALC-1]|nr:hypothetical protein FBALC1_03137 [Flavobacteriales bacterium ALC-1]
MNNSLAPTYKKQIGEHCVLWYSKSNSYSVVESLFKRFLDYYLQSETIEDFKAKIASSIDDTGSETIPETIRDYLNNCNIPITTPVDKQIAIDASNRNILKQYSIKGKLIQIYYDSELVLKTVHPSLAHLTTDTTDYAQTTFDIYLKNEQLYLYKDEELITCVPKKDYHLLQGKFIMQLLCTIHNKEENDWIGTFHGSTLTDGNSSILFVGESGKGKSTLCALLAASGFNLLADDVSPMLSKNKSIYYNPSAISIKEGAFNVLQPHINNFDALPKIQFNKAKGFIKYLPCDNPEKDYYPCNAIILVNYKSNAETILENISIKTLLETLIPDSWLSPDPLHAKQFLDWIGRLNIYKLTYSDTKKVTQKISELFHQLNKNL